MEKYIKPSCETIELADADHLMQLTINSEVTDRKGFAPKRKSLDESDPWGEDEDIEVYEW